MVLVTVGTASHVILCSTISGAGSTVTFGSGATDTIVYMKVEEPEFDISFNSKIAANAQHKSRITPDIKYQQGFSVTNGILLCTDVNTVTDWLMAAYIAKTKIYLLVEMPTIEGATDHYHITSGIYYKKTWYDDTNTKLYYCKGFLGKLKIKMSKGRTWRITFDFKECWG